MKATLGTTVGDLFLIDSLIAITVCSLAVHAGGIRMIFTMGRDNRLPFASAIAKVHGRSKTPLVPSIVIGVITILLLVLNVGNQRAFFVLTSVAIIMFYIAYLCVTGPLLIARLRGKWPTPEHGPYFNTGPLGRGGERGGRDLPGRRRWSTWPGHARRSTARTTGTSSGARSPSPGCSASSASPTTWPSCAAVRRRCWPSTGPTLLRRRSASPTSPPTLTRRPWLNLFPGLLPDQAPLGIADFLGSRPPFDAVGADDLARIAAVTETEVSPRGKTIFPQGAGPVEYLRMVRAGSVEVIHDGRVLDLLGPGELFGQASMISGLPTGFEARAAEDTVCYRIPADVVRPLLARPEVLRFVARSIVSGRARRRPARRRPTWCSGRSRR